MRLWQKIFLTTLALMVLSTTLVSALLLKTSRDALWQREYQRAVSQQQYLAGMLRAGVVSHRLQLGLVQLEEEDTRQAVAPRGRKTPPSHRTSAPLTRCTGSDRGRRRGNTSWTCPCR